MLQLIHRKFSDTLNCFCFLPVRLLINGCIMTSLSSPVEDSTRNTLTNRTTDWMADKKTSAAVKRKLSKHVSREYQTLLQFYVQSGFLIPLQDFLRKHINLITSQTSTQRCNTFFHWIDTLSLIVYNSIISYPITVLCSFYLAYGI